METKNSWWKRLGFEQEITLLGIVNYTKLNYAFMCKRATPFIFVSIYTNRLPKRNNQTAIEPCEQKKKQKKKE